MAGRSRAAAEQGPLPPGSERAGSPLLPVFRAAPYSAEAARQRRPSPTARILFLDDGCSCRAVLAQALLQTMLRWVGRQQAGGWATGSAAGRWAGKCFEGGGRVEVAVMLQARVASALGAGCTGWQRGGEGR